MRFMDDGVLLRGEKARELYAKVKDLPIIDYHCHLDQGAIAADRKWDNIGELWLAGDHYKWRAMRCCGVDERYITGAADYKDKFIKYAEIMPKLIGNPLYYWTHFELKRIFGIDDPLNANRAKYIYDAASERLRLLSARELMRLFDVRFVATTDDPADDLALHGKYDGITVSPTFRPDRLMSLDADYLNKLGAASGVDIESLDDLLVALERRLDHFVQKGCKMSDHGFENFPSRYVTHSEAEHLFARRRNITESGRDALRGYLLTKLAAMYRERGITMQLHFSVMRNVNSSAYRALGVDSGFDIAGEPADIKNLVKFLDTVGDERRPRTVLYTLNDGNLAALAAAAGAFRNVLLGAAWWFNDTVEGIRKNLSVIAEYGVLGNMLGMLSDSRSFSSYVRFDFFRRIACDYVGDKVERGEYAETDAAALLYDLCYGNAERMVK